MRDGYNSKDFWDRLNEKNKTIRGHMFLNELPKKGSIYLHTLSFSNKNGLNSIWTYFPSFSALLGYIQYSFLQENFYKWIYGREKKITKIPSLSAQEIVNKALKENKVSKAEAEMMKDDILAIIKIWKMPQAKGLKELKKFSRDFNRKWYGDSTEFLYLKIFETSEELGRFILDSCKLTSGYERIPNKEEYSEETWLELCKNAEIEIEAGEKFREILLKNLTEIL